MPRLGQLDLRTSQFARLPILISFTYYYRHNYPGPGLYPTAIFMIRVFHEHVGQEATRAYLKSLCTNASLDNLLGKTCGNKSFLKKQRPETPFNGEENIQKHSHISMMTILLTRQVL
jgi:hypothetical protein